MSLMKNMLNIYGYNLILHPNYAKHHPVGGSLSLEYKGKLLVLEKTSLVLALVR